MKLPYFNRPKKPSLLEIDSVLNGTIGPHFERIEAHRKGVFILTGLYAIPVLLAMAYLWSSPTWNGETLKLIALVPSALVTWLVRRRYRGYQAIFKTEVMVPLCQHFFPDLSYRPESHISKLAYDESGLFRKELSVFTGNDHFRGRLGDVDFEFSELNCSYESGSGKNRRTVQVFKGFFFVGDFHREIYFRTKIEPDVAEAQLGVLGRGLQRAISGKNLVDLEDPEFEKLFVVTSDDQVEARYILTPKFMELLKEFRLRLRVNVSVSFVNGKMFLAVYTNKDYFEPRIWGEIFRRQDLMHFIDSVNIMLQVASDFLHHPKFTATSPPPSLPLPGTRLATPPPLTFAQKIALRKRAG